MTCRCHQQRGEGFAEKYWLPLNTPVLDGEGQVHYLIHKVEEVTRQQQTEADLREEHRRLKGSPGHRAYRFI